MTGQNPRNLFLLQSSLMKRMLLLIIHLLAVTAACLNGLPLAIRFILLLGLGLSLIIWIWGYNSDNGVQISFSEQAGWQLRRDKGTFFSIRILPDSVVTVWGIALLFEAGERRQTLIIFNDMLSTRDFRKLTVLIKTSGLKKE